MREPIACRSAFTQNASVSRFAGPALVQGLVDVSNLFFIFILFFCSGRGKGESEAPGGGGVSRTGGAKGPGGFLRRIGDLGGGGGLNIFFSGPKCPPRRRIPLHWMIQSQKLAMNIYIEICIYTHT